MNGLDGAIQLGGLAQFFQGQIGFSAEQFAQFLAVDCHDPWLAPAAVDTGRQSRRYDAVVGEVF